MDKYGGYDVEMRADSIDSSTDDTDVGVDRTINIRMSKLLNTGKDESPGSARNSFAENDLKD